MAEWQLPKSEWGAGPWQDEPDRVEWRSHGLPCLIVRNMRVTGALCGYVGLPPGHPLHGVDYSDCPEFEVHGGLTYSNKCTDHIYHEPLPGESKDIWWLGFDCGHHNDIAPRLNALIHISMGEGRPHWEGESYRDINYVRGEVERLAAQLKEVK